MCRCRKPMRRARNGELREGECRAARPLSTLKGEELNAHRVRVAPATRRDKHAPNEKERVASGGDATRGA